MPSVSVDANKCIGCGLCVSLCPEIFEFGDDNKSHVKKVDAKAFKKCDVKNTADSCPVSAIKYKE